jgi:flagellar hook-basal body complex protein FliE
MPSPVNSFANAITAYNRALTGGGEAMEPRDTTGDDSFAGLVRNAVHGAINTGETGEKLSIAAVNDGADLNQVVTAVAEAEVTLNTVVAVRDKIIEAYKDIIRMPM